MDTLVIGLILLLLYFVILTIDIKKVKPLEKYYLTDMPQSMAKHGISKVLLVRKEMIHLKHIFTEMFVRKSINYMEYFNKINYSVEQYIEYMTNINRKIHHFNRDYVNDLNRIVKRDNKSFFKSLDLYKGLNNIIVLDFDGVVTSSGFSSLYKLCIERSKVYIVSANPTITPEWFDNKGLPRPDKIYSMKGKKRKMIQLLQVQSKYDNVYYIDDEKYYLEFAWIFGIKTYRYANGKIKYFSLNNPNK